MRWRFYHGQGLSGGSPVGTGRSLLRRTGQPGVAFPLQEGPPGPDLLLRHHPADPDPRYLLVPDRVEWGRCSWSMQSQVPAPDGTAPGRLRGREEALLVEDDAAANPDPVPARGAGF